MKFHKSLFFKSLAVMLSLCMVVFTIQVAYAANTNGVTGYGTKGIKVGIPGLQLTSEETAPTDAGLAAGRIYYDTTSGLLLYDGSQWVAVTTGTAGTADSVYNAGAWTVAVDHNDVIFTSTGTGYNFLWEQNVTGTSACMMALDAKHAGATVTDALLIYASGDGTITDGIDLSDTDFTNAINAGSNKIIAGTLQLDTLLDVNESVDIDLDASDETVTIGSSATDYAADSAIVTIDDSGAGQTNANYMLRMQRSASGDAQEHFLVCEDNNGTDKFSVNSGGVVAIASNLTVGGNLSVSGSWATDAIAASTLNSDLSLDGNGSGGVVLNATGTGGITLTRNATCTADLIVNGGDFTMTSATASKPNLLFTNSVVGATGSVTTYDHTRGGLASVDADDIHTDIYKGYDDGPASDTFVTVLYEITDASAGEEDGNVTWSIVSAGSDLNFLELDGIGGVEINAGAVDIDVHVDGNDQADLLVIDAGNNDVTITRNLAAGATTDSAMVTIAQSSSTADNGCLSVTNAAAASATDPTVVIQSSATGVVKSSLFVNHDGTAGATTESAVRIDSEDVNAAALYVTSPVTQAGTSAVYDETVAAFVAEGVGGALSLYRNVASATNSVLLVEDNHADSTGPLATFTYDGDDTADDVAVTFQATAAAYDEAVVQIVNAGVGRALFIDDNVATGATLEPSLEIDSQKTDCAALLIRSPVDASGSDGDFDVYAVGISAEGVGGALHVHRAVDDPSTALVVIEDDLAAITTSNANTLTVICAGDASVSDSVVEFRTTDAAHDQAVLQVTQAGTGVNILVDGVTPAVTIGDAGAEDAQINFDGAAQDYHIGLEDATDDLLIGKGTALGTTPAIGIDENLVVTIKSAINVPYEEVTAANGIAATEGGKTFMLNAVNEFASTLPTAASSAGMRLYFIIKTAPSGASYTIVTTTLENTLCGGINELDVDTGNDGPYIAAGDTLTFVADKAVAGDYVEFFCDGAKWYFHGQTNADGGVTVIAAD